MAGAGIRSLSSWCAAPSRWFRSLLLPQWVERTSRPPFSTSHSSRPLHSRGAGFPASRAARISCRRLLAAGARLVVHGSEFLPAAHLRRGGTRYGGEPRRRAPDRLAGSPAGGVRKCDTARIRLRQPRGIRRVRVLLRQSGALERFGRAVLLVAGLNFFAALFNLADLYAGFPPLLQYLRNASYAIFSGGEIAGVARITGTFAEASAFSGFALPLFAFTATLWLRKRMPAY